ncbi:hypothetical protein COCNU_04G002380 [Cocos nucifera]|uniref:Uncharacterized protein n=1 Tax=Cocos nucifera TaxID=13894 RepID=A0A8K0I590_COCNU|nr:hypothetical protein COCNU_04G002380 [Cocos nucifera]
MAEFNEPQAKATASVSSSGNPTPALSRVSKCPETLEGGKRSFSDGAVKSGDTKICLLIIDSISSLLTPMLGGKGSEVWTELEKENKAFFEAYTRERAECVLEMDAMGRVQKMLAETADRYRDEED